MARHDMDYFGGEVISLITKYLGQRPTIDRGSIRVWNVSTQTSLLLDMKGDGLLECHEASTGWTTFTDACSPLKAVDNDYMIDTETIRMFVGKHS